MIPSTAHTWHQICKTPGVDCNNLLTAFTVINGSKSIFRAVKGAYTNEISTSKIMEDVFDMDHLKAVSDGKGVDFDTSKYAERIKEDEERMPSFRRRVSHPSASTTSDSLNLDSVSDASDNDKTEGSFPDGNSFRNCYHC